MEHIERVTEEECRDLVDQYACETGGEIVWINTIVRRARVLCGTHRMTDSEKETLEGFFNFVKLNKKESNHASRITYDKCDPPKEEPAKDAIQFLYYVKELSLLVANNVKCVTTLLCNNSEMSVEQVLEHGHHITAAVFAPAHHLLLLATAKSLLLIYDTLTVSPPFPLKKKIHLVTSVSAMLFNESLSTLYLGMWDGAINIVANMSHRGGISVCQEHKHKWHSLGITVLKLIKRGGGNSDLLLIASLDSAIVTYDITQQCVFAIFNTNQGIRDCVWNNAYGALVSIATVAQAPVMWVLNTPSEYYNLTDNLCLHRTVLIAIVTHPSLPTVFTLDVEGIIKVWSLISLHISQVLRVGNSNSRSRTSSGGLLYIPENNILIAFSIQVTRWAEHSKIEDAYTTSTSSLYGIKAILPPTEADSECIRVVKYSHKTGMIITASGKDIIEWCGEAINPNIKESPTYSTPQVSRSITSLLWLSPATCTVICVTDVNKVFIGTSDGHICGYFQLQLLEKFQKAKDAVCFVLYSEGRKQLVAGHTRGTLIFHTGERTNVWESKIAAGCEITCAEFVNQDQTLIAVCTSIGSIHLIDTPARRLISVASASCHEINALVCLTRFSPNVLDEQILFATGTSGGIIYFWQFVHEEEVKISESVKCRYKDYTGFVSVLRTSRKTSNPKFLSKKYSSNRNRVQHYRRPAITVLQVSSTDLGLLFCCDDEGWVSVFDVGWVVQAIASDPKISIPGKQIKMISQWRAHEDEICSMTITNNVVVTAAILHTMSMLWSYCGEYIGKLCPSSPVSDPRDRKSIRSSVVVPKPTRSSLGLTDWSLSKMNVENNNNNSNTASNRSVCFPSVDITNPPRSPVERVLEETQRLPRHLFDTCDNDNLNLSDYLLQKKRKYINRLSAQRQIYTTKTQAKESPEEAVTRLQTMIEPSQWVPRSEISWRGRKWDATNVMDSGKPLSTTSSIAIDKQVNQVRVIVKTHKTGICNRIIVSKPPKEPPPLVPNPRRKHTLQDILYLASKDLVSTDQKSRKSPSAERRLLSSAVTRWEATQKLQGFVSRSSLHTPSHTRRVPRATDKKSSSVLPVSILNIRDMHNFEPISELMRDVESGIPVKKWTAVVREISKKGTACIDNNVKAFLQTFQQGRRGIPLLKKAVQECHGGKFVSNRNEQLSNTGNELDNAIHQVNKSKPNKQTGLSQSLTNTSVFDTRCNRGDTPDTPLTPDSIFHYNDVPFSVFIEEMRQINMTS